LPELEPDAHWQSKFAVVHHPICMTHRKVRNKPNVVKDTVLEDLCKTEFPEANWEYGVALPSLEASFIDYQKCSVDFDKCKRLDPKLIRKACDFVVYLMSPAIPKKCDLISLSEAITLVDKNTSPGFPCSAIAPTKGEFMSGKSKAHRRQRSGREREQRTAPNIELLVNRLRQGGWTFYSVSTKEELRLLEKLKADNVRTFVPGSLDECLLGIESSYEFDRQLCDAPLQQPITIGICLYYGQWDEFQKKQRFPMWSTDSPKWDGHYLPLFVWVCAYVQMAFSYARVWATLFHVARLLECGMRVFGNGITIFQKGTMPSGSQRTITWNSIAKLFVLILFFVQQGLSLQTIQEVVDINVHGDNLRYGVREDFRDRLNPSQLNAWLDEIHWPVYAVPYDVIPKSPPIVTYISHVSVQLNGKWVPIHETPMKLVCSIILGADREVPEGMSKESYHLSRFWQITNILFPDTPLWLRLVRVGEQYERMFDQKCRHDKSWRDAKAQRKSEAALVLFFTMPKGYFY